MPYPLEKLPYGLRRRLRELVTRSEAYDLQIAAPNYSGFRPVQKVQLWPNKRFMFDEENNLIKPIMPQNSELTNSRDVPLYVVSENLTFQNFTQNCKLNMILEDFRFSATGVYFYDCVLDETFVRTFVNAISNPIQHIELFPCLFTTKNAAKMLCNSPAFKALEEFYVDDSTFPSVAWWIEELLEAGCTSLIEFNIIEASPSSFKIDQEVLLKFIKAQDKSFELTFSMNDESEWHSNGEFLRKLLDEHFVRCDKPQYFREKKVISFYYENEDLQMCYILRDD